MQNITGLLILFDNTLRESNLKNYQLLYSPLNEEQIDFYFNKLGIEDNDLKALYMWKNGFNPDDNIGVFCQIFEYYSFLSLESALEFMYASRKQKIWADNFIPLVTDTTGQYLLFNNEKNDNYGKLYLYSVSSLIIEPISYYDSIHTMLETTIEAYLQGAMIYDVNEDWLEIDFKKLRKIAEKLNIDSEYWLKNK